MQFLTFSEIIYAAVLAFIITWVIKSFISFRSVVKSISTSFKYDIENINAIVDRCQQMFPMDKIVYKGIDIHRGMRIKIVTKQNTTFEGDFIGANDKNVLCIKTAKHIIAHELKNIGEIKVI